MVKICFEKQRGKFLKPCPGQRGYICCNLWVIEEAMGCPLYCKYCALQTYIPSKNTVLYEGIEKIEREIKSIKGIRVTTGQFSDSLALENYYPYLKKIYEITKNGNLCLEVKTKSINIKPLLELPSRKQIVAGFSLNSKEVWKNFEKYTSNPQKRIKAAKILEKDGFYLSFHFDPLIYNYSYREIIEFLTEKINEEKVLWISLGVLRFPKNFPSQELLKGEYFPSYDGKFRLYRPLREKIYKNVLKEIRKKWKNVFIYLCMENKSVWEKVFGVVMTNKKLKEILDFQAKKTF